MGGWVWGGENLPIVDSYCYLRIEFSSDGSWDKHIKSLVVHVIMAEFGKRSFTKESQQSNNNYSICNFIYVGIVQVHDIFTKRVQGVFTPKRLRNTTKRMIIVGARKSERERDQILNTVVQGSLGAGAAH